MEHDAEDRVIGQRYRFERQGEDLVVHVEAEPGSTLQRHLHPRLQETWSVVEGRVEFSVGRDRRIPPPGEPLVIEPGVRHGLKNVGDTVALLRVEAQPALELEPFLMDAIALNASGKLTPGGVPKGVGGILAAAAFAERYKETTVFVFAPLPPPALQRVLFPPLAWLGSRLGSAALHTSGSG